ncbi:MAG: 3-dehydroquinate synthase [Epulopiscium sp.]|jgi:3-dehydroquinate synthase|nr:3-dehydroquinate synthase [Candidatus Epulonipiscium sp.]
MTEIMVTTEEKSYPIIIADGFQALAQTIIAQKLEGEQLCIITDSNVASLYLEDIKKEVSSVSSEVLEYIFPAGEEHKTLEMISNFYEFFIKNHMNRKSIVVALGGGVCGDMAGFAAATYMRGIRFIQIPTTLLAQVDSSVGGKTGVDFMGSKNMIGAFYQPEFVYINTNTLHSLPKREFSAGMAEVIKYGYIISAPFLSFIRENLEAIMAKDAAIMKQLIGTCCSLKAQVVSADEKESGLREILNFGHTIGHAIETCKNFKLLHGECVGLGMLAAIFIGIQRGELPDTTLEECRFFLKKFDLPIRVMDVSLSEIYDQMFLDKKVKQNKISFVLLNGVGTAYSTNAVSKECIEQAILSVL